MLLSQIEACLVSAIRDSLSILSSLSSQIFHFLQCKPTNDDLMYLMYKVINVSCMITTINQCHIYIYLLPYIVFHRPFYELITTIKGGVACVLTF